MSDPTLPAAVLWDMDGTLVDTTPLWFDAEEALVTRFGGTWTHDQSIALMGRGLSEITEVMQDHGVAMTAAEIGTWQTDFVVQRLVAPLPWRPGALELLRALRDAAVPTALVTTATRRMATAVTAALPFEGFDLIVAGDEVLRSKPDPEGYLHAAELLGVDIARCVVLEDSVPGLAAGAASGASTIGIPHHAPLPAGSWRLWDTLAGRSPSDLVDDAPES